MLAAPGPLLFYPDTLAKETKKAQNRPNGS